MCAVRSPLCAVHGYLGRSLSTTVSWARGRLYTKGQEGMEDLAYIGSTIFLLCVIGGYIHVTGEFYCFSTANCLGTARSTPSVRLPVADQSLSGGVAREA